MNEKISIVIPCKYINIYVRECIQKCLALDYKNFEIILLPDFKIKEKFPKTKIIATGEVRPSAKRNIAISKAKGNIIAFIDSDAFPPKDWLKNAVKYFKDKNIGAVGGPNLTPETDSLMQKASGDILSSPIGAGKFALRYAVKKTKEVKELQSCNLFVKKNLLKKIKGFDVSLLTGEDAKLCFQIKNLGKKVIYAPDVIVFHHRRKLFKQHLKQIFIYGRDKAYLIKEDFSFDKIYYALPSIFVLALIFGALFSFFNQTIKIIYIATVLFYLVIVLIASLAQKLSRAFLIFFGLILTHISYGLGFLYGLLSGRKK